MSLESDIKAGSLERGRFRYFPVVPGRVEFSVELRKLLLAEKPPIVAVELPGFLAEHYERALQRLPEMSVILYLPDVNNDDNPAVYVPVEPTDPFIEALRSAREIGAEILFLEPDSADRPHLHDTYPDTYAIRHIGLDKYIEAYRVWPQSRSEDVTAHANAMAWKLQGADPSANVVVVVSLNLLDPLLDSMEAPQDPPPPHPKHFDVQLLNPHPDCLAEITVEYPYLQERYEFSRLDVHDADRLHRPKVQLALMREAEKKYTESTGEKVAHWQRRLIARYTRNLAHMSGDLVANVYDLAVAARSIIDDNYGWEVWQMANRYLAQSEHSDLETVRLTASEIWINTKRLRIRRRLPRPKQQLKPTGIKPRKREKTPGEWAKQTTGDAICSYPPEDLQIEDYGRFLKKKAKALLSEERVRVEPFTTSLLDGIDIRETIRNWHQQKIFVRHADRLAGEVGAVVIIFDEDLEDRYQYLTTWLGEHQNESDMAFYSTFPFDNIVGPGIGRAEYGGLLMTLPPRRLFDVWADDDYQFAETKPERLLMAALDYSVERFVVYVAAKPPRSIFRSIAAHLGRKILYVPIGALSPTRMKRLRVVHVLDSYERRAEAKDYIW
ncbi:MAG TPA: hypothetical protein VMT15_01115 [Bryobacteraceae bacterium]|nr:hypothetical protein [Bryobacteraceae bacterium]